MPAAKYLYWLNVRYVRIQRSFLTRGGTVDSPDGNEAELRRQFADHVKKVHVAKDQPS